VQTCSVPELCLSWVSRGGPPSILDPPELEQQQQQQPVSFLSVVSVVSVAQVTPQSSGASPVLRRILEIEQIGCTVNP
jgi:hypothetical protein